MQTSVSMAKEREEGEEEKRCVWVLVCWFVFFFELKIPNGARIQMGGISLHCVIRLFIKNNSHR